MKGACSAEKAPRQRHDPRTERTSGACPRRTAWCAAAAPKSPLDFAQRRTLGATLVLLLVASLWTTAGCTHLPAPKALKKLSWLERKPKPQVPTKATAVWTNTVLYPPGRKPIRGFGGRIFFFNDKSKDAIAVDGTLTIYAFDNSDPNADPAVPARKYVFTPEQLAQHLAKSPLGYAYDVWIPWGEIDGPPKKISLLIRFDARSGETLLTDTSQHYLPGSGKSESLSPATGLAQARSNTNAQPVSAGSHASPRAAAPSTTTVAAAGPTATPLQPGGSAVQSAPSPSTSQPAVQQVAYFQNAATPARPHPLAAQPSAPQPAAAASSPAPASAAVAAPSGPTPSALTASASPTAPATAPAPATARAPASSATTAPTAAPAPAASAATSLATTSVATPAAGAAAVASDSGRLSVQTRVEQRPRVETVTIDVPPGFVRRLLARPQTPSENGPFAAGASGALKPAGRESAQQEGAAAVQGETNGTSAGGQGQSSGTASASQSVSSAALPQAAQNAAPTASSDGRSSGGPGNGSLAATTDSTTLPNSEPTAAAPPPTDSPTSPGRFLAHFGRSRFPARRVPRVWPGGGRVRRQPYRATWLSALPPTPRSGPAAAAN